MKIKSISLFFIFFIFVIKNLYALDIKGYYKVYRLEKYDYTIDNEFKSYQGVTVGSFNSSQYGVGIFGTKDFTLSVNMTVGGQKVVRFDKGIYNLTGESCFINDIVQETSGEKIEMTLDTGTSKPSCLLTDSKGIVVITDFRDDPNKNYILKIFLEKEPYNNLSMDIKKGWQLVSFSNIIDPSLLFKNKNIVIWSWDSSKNKWKLWTENTTILNLINKYKLDMIIEISPSEGVWINNLENNFDVSIEDYNIQNYEFLRLNKGWNLVGITSSSTVDDLIKLTDLKVKTIWEWDTSKNKWKIWANTNLYPSLNIVYNYLDKILNLNKNSAYWIYTE